MKLWLDDMRKPPFGYDLVAKTADECIQMIKDHRVEHVSLDHDLCPAHYSLAESSYGYGEPPRILDRSGFQEKTGYAVLEWMREANVWVPEIHIHTLNTQGGEDMLALLKAHAPPEVVFKRVKPHTV
jgi:hypothetical protein